MNCETNGDYEIDLTQLNAVGFLIYQGGSNWWTLKKVPTPLDERELEERHSDYEEAVQRARQLYGVQKGSFTAIVRYNRGLGIEYKNIPQFQAETLEKAQNIASRKAIEILGENVEIREVRARPC